MNQPIPSPDSTPPDSHMPDADRTPSVWLLLSDKRGDNGQVETVIDALGWPHERKTLLMLPPYVYGKPRVRPSLHHIDAARSDPLEPPWPDLVITIGRRPSMVALWVKQQSGGRTRIVLVGKPSGMMPDFDMVVTSGEVQIAQLPNVLQVSLPLMRVDRTAVEAAARAWAPRFADLPRPLVALMVGGPTNPFVYDDAVTARLLALAKDIAADGGTPYVTTSRRTPEGLVAALRDGLPREARLYAWQAESRAEDNPYLGLLGLADGVVVTADSISMLTEVARLGRPLALFDLPCGRFGALDQLRRGLATWLFAPSPDGRDGLKQRMGRLVHSCGLLRHTRDFTALHRLLLDRGLAVPAGQPFRPSSGRIPDDSALVAARIRTLMEV